MEFLVALAQINPHVGNLDHNLEQMLKSAELAKKDGIDLVVFPELVLTGYPPEDLLHKPAFINRLALVEIRLADALGRLGIDAIYGSIRRQGDVLYNVGVLIEGGRESGYAVKWRLPNFSVFDEKRYFEPGRSARTFTYKGFSLGITICEDLWHAGEPMAQLIEAGAELIVNINASPYHVGKQAERESIARQRFDEWGLPILYVNMVGGQDELVFDGGSFVLNHQGQLVSRAASFKTDLASVSISKTEAGLIEVGSGRIVEGLEPEREIYAALSLGLSDYVEKNGFSGVVLGLSGGIDSALTAVICADALGANRVEALMMPSRYTSPESLEDARLGAKNIGIRLTDISIDKIFALFCRELAGEFEGLGEDVTEENIQPRIRATLLMAISNKKGSLLVTTGNKSEVSVGYATLYGDMAGGYSVLKDLLKQRVFSLSQARNRWAVESGKPPPIPPRVIAKPPSAELRPDQKDSDSLPPYPILDKILACYVEQEMSLDEIVNLGIERDCVLRVIRMVDRNEYKRRQAAPGVRITKRAFGKDRRYPITNGFKVS
ncbi:MAG: NAD+ synthase [Magnetococcales bacterium]|nr:NAD+ synthase [Magnetococcales bacterium]